MTIAMIVAMIVAMIIVMIIAINVHTGELCYCHIHRTHKIVCRNNHTAIYPNDMHNSVELCAV